MDPITLQPTPLQTPPPPPWWRQSKKLLPVIALTLLLVPSIILVRIRQLNPRASAPPAPVPPVSVAPPNPFGIMTWGERSVWGDANQTKMHIATELGAKYYRPLSINLNNKSLSCTECQAAIERGLKLVLTIRANGGKGIPTVPPTDWNAFSNALSQVLDKYKPEILVIENEENSDIFYKGTAQQYLDELRVGCEVAHSKNIKCTNGGLVSKLVVVLVSQSYLPDAIKADDYLRRALTPKDYATVSASIGTPLWQSQIRDGRNLLAGYKASGADFVNFHWHQENAETIPEAVTYLSTASQELPVINNEISPQAANSAEQVKSFMSKTLDLNLPYIIWYSNDADGIGGTDTALTDKDGSMKDSGRAYQQFIKDNFSPTSSPTPTPTPRATPIPTPAPSCTINPRIQISTNGSDFTDISGTTYTAPAGVTTIYYRGVNAATGTTSGNVTARMVWWSDTYKGIVCVNETCQQTLPGPDGYPTRFEAFENEVGKTSDPYNVQVQLYPSESCVNRGGVTLR